MSSIGLVSIPAIQSDHETEYLHAKYAPRGVWQNSIGMGLMKEIVVTATFRHVGKFRGRAVGNQGAVANI